MIKGVFLDSDWVGSEDLLNGLKELPVDWQFYPSSFSSEVKDRLNGATIAVAKNTLFLKESFAEISSLKLLCIAATGVVPTDLKAAKAAGIIVCNAPNYSTPCVAQHTMYLMLSLATNFNEIKYIHRKTNRQNDYPIRELLGKSLGIIGYGNIGKAVADLGSAFGMKILVGRHSNRQSSDLNALPMTELLKEADYISLHVPLTPETKSLIKMKEIELMKPTSFLINVARGGLIDESDLADALKEGRIAGAALDVLSEEPPPPDHPLLDPSIPNLILTPHVGWTSFEARLRLIRIVEDNIRRYLQGRPQNVL